MNKVVEFLKANPVQYLATVGRDGHAKCRPFMFADELDGKLWFCTNTQKAVYKDMQENPYVELSVSSPDYAWIRLHGKAVFSDSMSAQGTVYAQPHREEPVRRRRQPHLHGVLSRGCARPDCRLLRQSPL